MDILIFSSDFPPRKGGIEVFVYNICRQLTGRGHRVRVISAGSGVDKEFDQQQAFHIYRYNCPVVFSSFSAFCKILTLCLTRRPDIVFLGHFGSTHLIVVVLLKKALKIPYVILAHGSDVNAYLHGFTRIDWLFSRIVLHNADKVVANSGATKRLIEEQGYPNERVYIVNPGVDIKRFVPLEDNEPIRKQFRLENKKVLLSVGRLVKRKGHQNVIESFSEVIKKIPELIFIIIGKGSEESRLKRLVKDRSLENYVRFIHGASEEEKLAYYQACDVFIMASFEIGQGQMKDYEGFGIVYLEANACAKPVIAGRTGGIEDAVVDGVTGITVDPENIGEISEAIIRLLTDQDYAKKLGDNGRRRAEEGFGWPMVAQKVEAILEKTVQDNIVFRRKGKKY